MLRRRPPLAGTLKSLFHRPQPPVLPKTPILSPRSPTLIRFISSLSIFPSHSTPTRCSTKCLRENRTFATRAMNEGSNRPPNETILLDGCDFEHWLVVVEAPDPSMTRDQIIDSYIKTLGQVLGSEQEARMKIYSVSTRHYFAFGCLVSEELSLKIKELPHVRWVLPDSYLNVQNKDYGGEPFINGQAVPYDPKYHELWVHNHQESIRKNNNKNRDNRRGRRDNVVSRGDMHQPSPQPPPASNPNSPASSGQNFAPSPNYQNQDPRVSNAGYMPPQRVGVPSQAPSAGFQSGNIPPPVQYQQFQNNYPPPPMQNKGYRNPAPPPLRNEPQSQNVNYPGRDMPYSGNNNNFPARDVPSPIQNSGYPGRDVQQPGQYQNFSNRDVPVQGNNYRTDSQLPVQNPNFANRDTPYRNDAYGDVRPPVQNYVPQSGDQWSQGNNSAVGLTGGNYPKMSMPNQGNIRTARDPGYPSQDLQRATSNVNGQRGFNDNWGTSGVNGSGIAPNRDYQSRDAPYGENEAIASRSF